MARAVLISYYFPPLVGAASERAAALSGHLSDLGWETVVVTTRDGFYHRSTEEAEPRTPVVRTQSLELSRFFRRGYAVATRHPERADDTTVRAVEAGDLGSRARRLVRDLVYLPDAQVGWIPFAARAAGRALREKRSSAVVFSTSGPVSAHLAAMGVAKRCGVPWVAEFRDPWSTDHGPNRTRSPLRQRINRALERFILRSADHVVVVTETMRRDMMEIAPELAESQISVVTNGFEPTPEGRPPAKDEPMTVLYAGMVAPGENMSLVLAAFDAAHARHPGSFELRVLGPSDAWRDPVPANAQERPWLRLDGMVSAKAARASMAQSSALLLVRHPAYRAALPAKAFEYIGVRRPIIAVVPPGSEMEALVDRHADARVVHGALPEPLVAVIEKLLAEHRAGELQAPRVPRSLTLPLERRSQAKRLAEIFDTVLGRAT